MFTAAVCRQQRFLALTVVIVAVPISLAWSNPSLSKSAFALTGATGVCLVCYIIPIVVHFLLLFPRKPAATSASASTPQNGSADSPESSAAARFLLEEDVEEDSNPTLMTASKQYSPTPETLWGWAGQAGVPVIVLVIGCGLSGLALFSSLKAWGHATS